MSHRTKRLIDRLARLATTGVDAALIESHNEIGLLDRQLRELRLGVLSVMPENWREDPDWVALVEAQELTPNDQHEGPEASAACRRSLSMRQLGAED